MPVPLEDNGLETYWPNLSRGARLADPDNLAAILLQFRGEHATDMRTLFKALGLSLSSDKAFAFDIVRDLIKAGLLEADEPRRL